MRNRLLHRLHAAAALDPSLTFVTGDLGYSVVESFATAYPRQFVNAGIAEQNMAGLAAGMAMTGRRVFLYSIVNFAVTRCLEQLRNDVCYHDCNVCVVSVGGGVAYGTAGYSHMGIEDIAFMRVLPGMRVYAPADVAELDVCLDEILAGSGPTYLRLGKGGEPSIHTSTLRNCDVNELAPPSRVTIVTAGPIAHEAQRAVQALSANGSAVGLLTIPHLSSDNARTAAERCNSSETVVVLEEHSPRGGLAALMAEAFLESKAAPRVLRWGVEQDTLKKVGTQHYLRALNRIDAASLAIRLTELLSQS